MARVIFIYIYIYIEIYILKYIVEMKKVYLRCRKQFYEGFSDFMKMFQSRKSILFMFTAMEGQ